MKPCEAFLSFTLWSANRFGTKDLGFEWSWSVWICYTTIRTTSSPQDQRLFFFFLQYNKCSQRVSAHFSKAQIHFRPAAGVLQHFRGADLIDCALGCPTLCLCNPCQPLTNGLWEVAHSGGFKEEGHRGPHGLRWSDCAESANRNAECQQENPTTGVNCLHFYALS